MRETDLLDRYLLQERGRPFEWTSLANGDCQLFPCGWAEVAGWPSAGVPWRGHYRCEDEARALLSARGGAVVAWTDLLGPPRMGSAPQRGDIGLLETDGWHLGMICTGSMWAFRDGRRGVRLVRACPDIFWSVGFA